MFSGKKIFITGGTGWFGNAFVTMMLEKYSPKSIIIYSRDEMKQWEMANRFNNDNRLKFIIGDVRDKENLERVVEGVDYLVHAAATKIVPTAEYNPFECIKTNIIGAVNVIDVCIEKKVKKVVALSTDKASNPVNLYGATKLASDKLFIASNAENSNERTKFSVVRYGNVIGSRGSVLPFFLSKVNEDALPITDVSMTRFMITLESAVELVWSAFEDMYGGEIYVKKIPSMSIADIAKAVSPKAKFDIIGIRPGEKLHEQMIGFEDAPYTYEYEDHYKILPSINKWYLDSERIGKGEKVPEDFIYKSDNNKEWMTIEELRTWIELNTDLIGNI